MVDIEIYQDSACSRICETYKKLKTFSAGKEGAEPFYLTISSPAAAQQYMHALAWSCLTGIYTPVRSCQHTCVWFTCTHVGITALQLSARELAHQCDHQVDTNKGRHKYLRTLMLTWECKNKLHHAYTYTYSKGQLVCTHEHNIVHVWAC